MPYTLLTDIPKVVGQYADGRPEYDTVMPLPGVQPQEVILGGIDPADVQELMDAHRTRFEADQVDRAWTESVRVKWHELGYILSLEFGVIGLYQLEQPGYTPPYVAPDEV